jgi:hypothetical protein
MTSLPTLASLEYLPYLNEAGETSDDFSGKVGVFAVFDQAKILQFIGYSRDVSLSLKQHLVRQPEGCYWVKIQTIDRPSRTVLEEIREAWITENGITPVGNGAEEAIWTQPIDAKATMTEQEKSDYASMDEMGKTMTLKQVARRVEAEVLAKLESRGVKMPIRFDPKLKEEGLLGLK